MSSPEATDPLILAQQRVRAFLTAITISHADGGRRTSETPMEIYTKLASPLGQISIERPATDIIVTDE
jgi:hypothetical protein